MRLGLEFLITAKNWQGLPSYMQVFKSSFKAGMEAALTREDKPDRHGLSSL